MAVAAGTPVFWYCSDATAKTGIPNEVTVSAVDSVDPQWHGTRHRDPLDLERGGLRFTDLRDGSNYG